MKLRSWLQAPAPLSAGHIVGSALPTLSMGEVCLHILVSVSIYDLFHHLVALLIIHIFKEIQIYKKRLV